MLDPKILLYILTYFRIVNLIIHVLPLLVIVLYLRKYNVSFLLLKEGHLPILGLDYTLASITPILENLDATYYRPESVAFPDFILLIYVIARRNLGVLYTQRISHTLPMIL